MVPYDITRISAVNDRTHEQKIGKHFWGQIITGLLFSLNIFNSFSVFCFTENLKAICGYVVAVFLRTAIALQVKHYFQVYCLKGKDRILSPRKVRASVIWVSWIFQEAAVFLVVMNMNNGYACKQFCSYFLCH